MSDIEQRVKKIVAEQLGTKEADVKNTSILIIRQICVPYQINDDRSVSRCM